MTVFARAWRLITAWFAPAQVDPTSPTPSLGPYRDAAPGIYGEITITGGRARPGDGVGRLE